MDLLEPGNRGKSRDARFLKRVFTPTECLRILLSRQGDCALWSLWAAKEAAFKVMRKRDPGVCSQPRKFPVLLFPSPANPVSKPAPRSSVTGIVATPLGTVHVLLQCTPHYVHCIGTDAPMTEMKKIRWQVNDTPADGKDESQHVREKAKRHLAQHFREPLEAIDIRTDGQTGVPSAYLGENCIPIDLSLSHDGGFTAHAFLFGAVAYEQADFRSLLVNTG